MIRGGDGGDRETFDNRKAPFSLTLSVMAPINQSHFNQSLCLSIPIDVVMNHKHDFVMISAVCLAAKHHCGYD